ncbi:MAG: oligosaccharide flippase family protein [Candidatus Brocadiaceae bacterium]|nr:oligosaccharide flippase family protein [Candidatus Brocadiaceae bacterium]
MQASHPESAAAPERSPRSIAYRIVRAMFVVLFFWVFWKFGGYIITALVVRHFGSGATSDAYFFATQAVVYGLIFGPAMGVLVPAFIPVFTQERLQRGEEAAWAFARSVLWVVLLGCGAMAALVYAYAGPVTGMLVRGFEPEAAQMGVRMLRLLVPGVVLMVVFLLFRSLLHSDKVFAWPAAAEAAQKLLWVAVFAVGVGAWGIRAAIAGFVVGSAAMAVIGAFGLGARLRRLRPAGGAMSSRRVGIELAWGAGLLVGTGAALWGAGALMAGSQYRDLVLMTIMLAAVLLYSLSLWARSRRRTGAMARFGALAAPLVVGAFFACYRNAVTVHFQSFTHEGMFTDMEAARKLVNFPTELVALALSVAMLPYLCDLAGRKDRATLGDVLTRSLRMLALAFVPLTVMTFVLADPVCRLVFDRGDRAAEHLRYTALALRLLSLGLVVYAAERVIMQGFFSLQRMWAPTLLGIAGAFVQVGLMVVPIYVLGMEEPLQVFVWVALSYPISRAVKNAALLLLLRRHAPVLPLREGVVFALRLAVLSALVGAAVWGTLQGMQRWLPYEQYRAQVVSLGTGMVERTPPRTLHYAAALLLHCGVSTGAGLFVMGVLLKVLGFPELGYLIEWVRDRGWRRRAAEEGAPDAVA